MAAKPHRSFTHFLVLAAGLSVGLGRLGSVVAFPIYDHIVIVVEENHSASSIIGATDAPYINSLAKHGLTLTNFYAITHPSQPNYLEMFSGSSQNVFDNSAPASESPYTTPNLGAALIAAGRSFVGYSEDLPAIGSTVTSSGQYFRKHNPWVNWQNDPQSPNQLAPATNQPFTSFPSDFGQLPYLSFVVPNQDHDMHDGTVAEGDAWLKGHLSGYADWAQTHSSLLIVTWDEDDRGGNNKIPTVIWGSHISQGQNNATWTLHNLLRTMEDVAGTTHAGSAADVRPISGMFVTDPAAAKKTFQQGLNGYQGVTDSHLRQDAPTISFSSVTPLIVDLDDNPADGFQPVQALIKFDSLIGSGVNQIPAVDSILSAKLVFSTTNISSAYPIELHRMKATWDASATWDSMNGGIGTDDTEALAQAEFKVVPYVPGVYAIFDVTATVQAWLAGETNNGWAILTTGTDGWRWNSSEHGTVALRPFLEVTYSYPAAWSFDGNGNWSAAANWNPGVPNAVEATATFGGAATASRIITLDADMLVGKLVFDNSKGYTIAGSNTLSLQGGIGNASIYVEQGSHAISAPLVLLADMNSTIVRGQLQISGNLSGNGHALINNGLGTLVLAGTADIGNLEGLGNLIVIGTLNAISVRQNTLAIGGLVTLNPNGTTAATSRVNNLLLIGSGTFDLSNNDLVIQSDIVSRNAVLLNTTNKVASGFHGGLWDGDGIISSVAADDASRLTALGVVLNIDELGNPMYSSFGGETVDSNSVLVAFTYYGDADLGGVVDGTDYALIDNGFSFALSGWLNGDFNYDGRIDGTDYALIDNAFNFQDGTLVIGKFAGRNTNSQAVPEPGSFIMLAIGVLVSLAPDLHRRIRAGLCAPHG